MQAQAQNGYDLIKMHELDDTTTGLSLASCPSDDRNGARRRHSTRRPRAEQSWRGRDARGATAAAHLGNLSNIYFLPLASHRGTLLVTATAFFLLIAAATLSGAPPLSRAMALFAFVAFVCLALFLPGGPLFESLALRILVTILTGLVAAGVVLLALVTMKLWGDPRSSTATNVRATVALAASAALAIVLSTFWTPIAWRSSTRGIDALAARLHDAGIPVQSTLSVYEAIGGFNRFYRLPAFNMKVARALHRAGVTLVAGTDARGIPQMPPGTSLHRELQLLHESGLSPYEVIRSATVAPAAFLRKEQEFGTVTAGQRADLLLVERNPLDDLTTLKTPLGVMARGRWYPHGQAKQE